MNDLPTNAEAAKHSSLDMSLDDLISSNPQKRQRRQRRHNPMARANAGARNIEIRGKGDAKAGTAFGSGGRNQVNSRLQANSLATNNAGSKITVSNLHPKVTRKDMVDLFSQVGGVSNVQLTFDAKGNFRGVATVSFTGASDAMNAVTKYHNVMLDGKPMHIEMIMTAGVAGILSTGGFRQPPHPTAGGLRGGGPRPRNGGRFR